MKVTKQTWESYHKQLSKPLHERIKELERQVAFYRGIEATCLELLDAKQKQDRRIVSLLDALCEQHIVRNVPGIGTESEWQISPWHRQISAVLAERVLNMHGLKHVCGRLERI